MAGKSPKGEVCAIFVAVGEIAIGEVEPKLKAIADATGQPPAPFDLFLGLRDPVSVIWEWMEKEGLFWCWSQPVSSKHGALRLWAFRGEKWSIEALRLIRAPQFYARPNS